MNYIIECPYKRGTQLEDAIATLEVDGVYNEDELTTQRGSEWRTDEFVGIEDFQIKKVIPEDGKPFVPTRKYIDRYIDEDRAEDMLCESVKAAEESDYADHVYDVEMERRAGL